MRKPLFVRLGSQDGLSGGAYGPDKGEGVSVSNALKFGENMDVRTMMACCAAPSCPGRVGR